MRSGVFYAVRVEVLEAVQVRRVGGWCEMAASLGVSAVQCRAGK
jgi:hypothetical protein